MTQFKLPDSIKFLSLDNNRLQTFEFYKIPENLTHFDIQNNFLQELILNSPANLKVNSKFFSCVDEEADESDLEQNCHHSL